MALEYRCLRAEELDKWYDHCNTVFRESRQYFVNHFINDPYATLNGIFVAVDNERIIATVRVFHREIYLNGRIVSMGGIGEVSTKPSYRRQGISERLLKMAATYMEENDLVVSELFTSSHHHYDRFGWQIVKTSDSSQPTSLLKSDLPQNTTLRYMKSDDIPAMRGIYDLYAGAYNGTVIRDTKYWNDWMTCELKRVSILESEGRPVAYIDWTPGNKCMMVREFAAIPEFTSAIGSMAYAIASYEDLDSIKAPLPLLSGGQIEESNALMVRLIKPFDLGGESIDTIDKLCDVYGKNTVMFPADGF